METNISNTITFSQRALHFDIDEKYPLMNGEQKERRFSFGLDEVFDSFC